jgi:hypothetical protein
MINFGDVRVVDEEESVKSISSNTGDNGDELRSIFVESNELFL